VSIYAERLQANETSSGTTSSAVGSAEHITMTQAAQAASNRVLFFMVWKGEEARQVATYIKNSNETHQSVCAAWARFIRIHYYDS